MLIIEDGTGKPDATSYNTRAELIAYASARGVTVEDEDASDKHLVLASDYIETITMKGAPVDAEQALSFPRVSYTARDELEWPSDEVPPDVKRAHLMLALASVEGLALAAPVAPGAQLKRRKTGPMEREFFEGINSLFATVPGVTERLSRYVYTVGQPAVVRT